MDPDSRRTSDGHLVERSNTVDIAWPDNDSRCMTAERFDIGEGITCCTTPFLWQMKIVGALRAIWVEEDQAGMLIDI
jgi:hypothetical protein